MDKLAGGCAKAHHWTDDMARSLDARIELLSQHEKVLCQKVIMLRGEVPQPVEMESTCKPVDSNGLSFEAEMHGKINHLADLINSIAEHVERL